MKTQLKFNLKIQFQKLKITLPQSYDARKHFALFNSPPKFLLASSCKTRTSEIVPIPILLSVSVLFSFSICMLYRYEYSYEQLYFSKLLLFECCIAEPVTMMMPQALAGIVRQLPKNLNLLQFFAYIFSIATKVNAILPAAF